LSKNEKIARNRPWLLLCTVALLALGACTQRTPENQTASEPAQPNQAATELPRIAAIGGVQDVWPFSFGLDADRPAVESDLGPPDSSESRAPGGRDTNAFVVMWDYPGVTFTFYVDEAAEVEDILTARVSSPDVALRGGLAIGMTEDEAKSLLGEPGYRAGDELVYFYYSTTMELVIRAGRLVEIVLARAMP
jgi:hypothetical protein